MENESTKHLVETTTSNTNIKHHNASRDSKLQVVTALSMLDTMYKKNISDYAEKLYSCTQEIENKQTQLTQFLKEKEPHNATLIHIKNELDYTIRLLEKTTEEWCQKSVVINELDNELAQLNHASDERKDILRERNKTLENLKIEIEDNELLLLEHELERQNILLVLEPIERKIMSIEEEIQILESQKRYIEASQLHSLTPTIQSSSSALLK